MGRKNCEPEDASRPLREVLFLAFIGIYAGCSDWAELERYAAGNISWLRRFYRYEDGTPSGEEIREIFGRIPNDRFHELMTSYLSANIDYFKGCLLLEDSRDFPRHYALEGDQQMLEVWEIRDGISWSFNTVQAKTGDTGIRKWLRSKRSLKGSVVILDQPWEETWKTILSKRGDCIGDITGSHSLSEEAALCFDEDTLEYIRHWMGGYLLETRKIRSRVETREYYLLDAPEDPDRDRQWGRITSYVCLIKSVQSAVVEKRYYISTLRNLSDCAQGIELYGQRRKGNAFREEPGSDWELNACRNLVLLAKMDLELIRLLKILPTFRKASVRSIKMVIGKNQEILRNTLISVLNPKSIMESLSGVVMTETDGKKARKLQEEEQRGSDEDDDDLK